MRLLHARLALTIALLALSACDRNASTPTPAAPSTPPAASTSVKPQSGDIPASTSPAGPAEGATAIGGVTGGKQDGGASKGGAPAPTGGDGAAPKSESETQKSK